MIHENAWQPYSICAMSKEEKILEPAQGEPGDKSTA